MDNFEEFKSHLTPWAFTIKKLGLNDVVVEDYIYPLEQFAKFGLVDCQFFEKDSHGKLHVHGIVLLRKNFFRKRLIITGYHIKLDELYNRGGWERYITKAPYLFDEKYEVKSIAKEEFKIPTSDFGGPIFSGSA